MRFASIQAVYGLGELRNLFEHITNYYCLADISLQVSHFRMCYCETTHNETIGKN